ncbi:MAG TPA: hypothetical protein GX503_07665 [Clostridiales bacterium]|nr:hypothetical protein [Clostridiales bacterium]
MVKLMLNITKMLERFAAKHPSVYRIASLYYKRLVKEEVALANIQPTDKVLCIGGGPCPFSGILLHEYTGAHVTIIDNDDCCVSISRELIRRLGYADFIDILYSDGKDISPEDYNVIHMAVQVTPMEQVFSHLKQGCRFGSKILVRLPKKRLRNFYSIGDRSVFHSCCGKVVHGWRNIDSTALFIKT